MGFGAPMTPRTRQHSRQPHPWRAYQGQQGSTCAPPPPPPPKDAYQAPLVVGFLKCPRAL